MKKNNMHIKVKVYPDAGEEKILQMGNTDYEIYTREEAREGKANKRVISLLLELPGFVGRRLRIVGGHKSQNKIIDVS